jgi:adenylate kinase
MRIILLGAPGAGKGTQAKILEHALSIRHLSMGDILRDEMRNGTDLGQEVKRYVESGGLVPDDVVTRIIEAKFQDLNFSQKGYLLDGFPRTLQQAKDLDRILLRIDQPIDYVIYMEVDSQVVIQRLTGRRVCKECGAVYHTVNMPPKTDSICDVCSGELYQRADDNEETIKKRINVYLESTSPIIDHYKKQGLLLTVDGNQNAMVLRDQLLSIFEKDGKIGNSQIRISS